MNEADSSPGNGAPVAQAAPTEPQAQAAPGVDLSQLVAQLAPALASTIDEKLSAQENRIFANLRKAGALKQDKPVEHPAPTPQSQQAPGAPTPAQSTGLSMADVEALLERERVIATRAAQHGLSDAQTRRLKSALASVEAGSYATEADAYLADMGLVKTAPAPQAIATQTQATPAKPNISDRGTAAPTDLRDSEGVLNSRPLEMTDHDLDALKQKYGESKGLQMFQDRVNAALRNIKIIPPGGGRRR